MEKNNREQKKIRVALYLPLGKRNACWSGIGGAEKRLSYLLSHMDSFRFDVSIVFRFYDDYSLIKKRLGNYISEECESVFVASNKEAFQHFRNAKYDFVLYDDYMVETKIGVMGALVAGSTRVLIFVTVPYAYWSFKEKWHSIIMRQNVQMASQIDTLYPASLAALQEKFSPKLVTVTPCSLPFLNNYLLRSKCVKENIMVFSGRLISEKNPLLLIDAVRLCQQQIIDNAYQIWICGKGEQEELIISRIQKNGLDSVVKYKGLQDMSSVLPKAKVFFSLQEEENYPSQSLLEAIASGCYCIATNVGDTSIIVQPTFGVLVEKTPRSLANAIQAALLIDKKKYESIYENSTKFAQTYFDPTNAIQHYEAICSGRC